MHVHAFKSRYRFTRVEFCFDKLFHTKTFKKAFSEYIVITKLLEFCITDNNSCIQFYTPFFIAITFTSYST